MSGRRLTEIAREAVTAALRPGDAALDATAGGGRDTLFLSHLVGPRGFVLAMDIQERAVAKAAKRLTEGGAPDNVRLVRTGHEALADHLPQHLHGHLRAAMFNLGWLPGGNPRVVTRPDTTLAALRALLPLAAPEAVITLHCYLGHPGGAEEADAVLAFAASQAAWRPRIIPGPARARNRELLVLLGQVAARPESTPEEKIAGSG